MDKRYQVFVSSTYADLKDERSRVIQTLMEMDCIPAGMELFPALDEEQFEFIKKVIDDCDYYLLIIGGRYGSTTDEGISYTEKEFDYAVAKGLKVIAFLLKDPDSISVAKTDKDPALAQLLQAFRAKVETSRLVKYWEHAKDLPGLVSLSLLNTIKRYPAVGWVRGTSTAAPELLEELHTLRKRNDELEAQLAALARSQPVTIVDLAGLDQPIVVHGARRSAYGSPWYDWKIQLTFSDAFGLIAPHLLAHPNDATVAVMLKKAILKFGGVSAYESKMEDQDFQTIKIQLKALGLIDLNYMKTTQGGMSLFWTLTEEGERKMTELRTIRQG